MKAHFIIGAGRMVDSLKLKLADGRTVEVAAEEVAEWARQRDRRDLWKEADRRKWAFTPGVDV